MPLALDTRATYFRTKYNNKNNKIIILIMWISYDIANDIATNIQKQAMPMFQNLPHTPAPNIHMMISSITLEHTENDRNVLVVYIIFTSSFIRNIFRGIDKLWYHCTKLYSNENEWTQSTGINMDVSYKNNVEQKKASCKSIPIVHTNDSISINLNNRQNNSKYC